MLQNTLTHYILAFTIFISLNVTGEALYAQRMLPVSDLERRTIDKASFEENLEQAINAFYQADWDETRIILSDLRNYNNSDLRVLFFEAMIPFWAYFFGGNESHDANLFLDYSARAIEMGDRILAATPQDTSVILLMGGLHGYRSLVAASERRYRTAISSGVTGHSFTRVLLAMDNDDPNTLMGQGVFEYMIGSIPKEGRWLARLAGLSGSVERGFEILEEAARSDSYIRNDAAMFLAYFYEQEGRFDDARRHLHVLWNRYPNNIIFSYNLARLYESEGNNDMAKSIYARLADKTGASVPILITRSKERLQALQ